MLKLGLIAIATVAAGLRHVPARPGDKVDAIAWSPDYSSALSQAGAQHKPLLVVMIAGARDGEC